MTARAWRNGLTLAGLAWLLIAAALYGGPLAALALIVGTAAVLILPLPTRCDVYGHEIRTYEARDTRLQWYWTAWRCTRCRRLVDDVRTEWAR